MSSRSPSEALAGRLGALTLELCRIPSVTGDEAALADWLMARLGGRSGLECVRVGHSVAVRAPWTGRPRLALFGHTDTVPPHAGDPAPHLDGLDVVGLGASDMKSGLAVQLALLDDLDFDALPYDLAFVFYEREEGPMADNGLRPLLDAVPWLGDTELAFCLEPSDNQVQVGCMGTLHAQVAFIGKRAHSGRPWQGVNAVHAAAPLLAELAERQPVALEVGGFLWREVISATLAQGGTARNVVPDRFELNLNYRFAPGRSTESARQVVQELVGDRAELRFAEVCPSGPVVTENPLLRAFVAHTEVSVAPKQAWTDVAQLGEVGIDAVNFGPGASAQAHQAGERVSVEAIAEGYRLFRSFLDPR